MLELQKIAAALVLEPESTWRWLFEEFETNLWTTRQRSPELLAPRLHRGDLFQMRQIILVDAIPEQAHERCNKRHGLERD